jgi:hypothetical protein
MIKLKRKLRAFMPAAELYSNSLSIDKAVVSEIHRSKISQHRAKNGYD